MRFMRRRVRKFLERGRDGTMKDKHKNDDQNASKARRDTNKQGS